MTLADIAAEATGVMHPLAWLAIRALVGKNITQIDLDKGLRTEQSRRSSRWGWGSWPWAPRSFSRTGATSWSVTKCSVAAAAASLLALMGLALVYASREVRLGAARSAA